MAVCCDLEVDVNGEETFMVDKKLVSLYSDKLRTLFGKSTNAASNFKVIFNDFPGGPESFELMLRFCYNNGKIDITSSNISLLHSAAEFMEMGNSMSGINNLIDQTEKSLQEINCWTWSELLVTIKHCQDLPTSVNTAAIIEKCMDSLITRVTLASESSPCPSTSSPDSSGFRLSFDTRSTESFKNSSSKSNWWFEDFLVLNADMVEMLVRSMVSRKFDHAVISRFLFYYQKSKFSAASSDAKQKIVETVIDMLYILEWNSVSCRSLFRILQVASSSNIGKCSRNKLESMIGSQMDQATLDNVLIPSPYSVNYLYDVNLVLRLLKAFLHGGANQASPIQLSKVACLMDMYIAEVAPDPSLKPSKFLALIMSLPSSARDSHDKLYHALDMYLEAHAGLSGEEKMKLRCVLTFEKLSAEACIHLSQNKKFPSKTAVQALMSQQVKLKNLLERSGNSKSRYDTPCTFGEIGGKGRKTQANDQIVLYAGNLDSPTENEKLRAHLQGMQWRVMELEKVCRKMQNQMTKIMKSKSPSHITRSLPKLCS